jgi:8-oxo-dGTP pyrophosphatase MutT (NUDIX family)
MEYIANNFGTISDIFPDANGKPYCLPQDEKVHWRISGYAVALREEKILMVTPSWSPLWELPGGGIEEKEMILDGIRREFYEETGYQVGFPSKTPFHVSERNFYHRHEEKFYHSIVMVYVAEITSEEGGTPKPPPEEWDEIRKIEWVSINELSDENCHSTIWPALSYLKNHPFK